MQPSKLVSQVALADFCQCHHIATLSLFGSVLRDDFHAASDIDVLVEFAAEQVPGFIELHEIEQEFSQLLGGRKVDLVTPKFLNRRIRERVLSTAEVQYAQG